MKSITLLDRFTVIRFLSAPHEKIVDIGCSLGELFGDRATNVDFISAAERRTWVKDPSSIPDIPNFILARAESLPFKDKTYDIAILSEIIEHHTVKDPAAVIREAQRVAKTVIIAVPNEHQWAPARMPFKNEDHIRWYTEETLFQLCNDTNLTVLQFIKNSYDGWSYFIVYGISKP